MQPTMQPNFAAQKPLSRSLRIYQKAAIVFVVISLILLLGVLYLSLSSATITVTPSGTVVSSRVAVDVNSAGPIVGVVHQDTFTKARMFELPEEGATAVEGKAGGMVTLINETNASQQLVATTRLLSEEGILFRLDEGVTIPANGQIEAVAHADQPGLSSEIGPTQFTIPGLSPSLQSVIYAVSVESMTGGVQYVRVLSEADLEQASESLKQEILEEAKTLLRTDVDQTALEAEVFDTEVVEKKSDTQPGTETGVFTLSMTVRVTGVFYKTNDVAQAAENALYQELQAGFEVMDVNRDRMQVSIRSTDAAHGAATLEVYLDGLAVLSTGADVLDKNRLVGKSADEVKTMLEASESIEHVRVRLSPFWLTRIPKMKDHITIQVLSVSQ